MFLQIKDMLNFELDFCSVPGVDHGARCCPEGKKIQTGSCRISN